MTDNFYLASYYALRGGGYSDLLAYKEIHGLNNNELENVIYFNGVLSAAEGELYADS